MGDRTIDEVVRDWLLRHNHNPIAVELAVHLWENGDKFAIPGCMHARMELNVAQAELQRAQRRVDELRRKMDEL